MTSSRPPRPTPLPGPAAALQAAAAGRWRVAGTQLRLDPAACMLLGEAQAQQPLHDWLARLPANEAQALAAALAQPELPLAQTLHLAGRTLLLRASAMRGRWQGLVLELPLTEPLPAPALSARDEFFAAISHELRTPLNAMLGFNRLARASQPGPEVRRHLDHMADASRVMLRVVNDLLDLARLEAGKLEIEHDLPLPLPALVVRVARLAAALRGDKPIRLYAAVDPACPAHLRGDALRIEQVLLNLLSNALKFTEKGTVALGVRLRRRQGDHVALRFSVADTGIGIALDKLDRIGRPFERADDSSVQRAGGTGLGLAVVRRLLELHGTQLKVASVAGGGTIFWFDLTLPLDPATPEPPPEDGVPATAVLSGDARLLDTVATQWRAQRLAGTPCGAVVGPLGAAQAAHWVVDLADPRAEQHVRQAEREGRRCTRVSAEPVAPGSGVVALPLLAANVFAEDDGEDALRADPALQGLRVLVLEDNPLNQQVIAEFLGRLGAQVVLAGDGRRALQCVQQAEFDVALLDIQLPGESGLWVAHALRQLPAGRTLPLVFLSAHLDADDRLAAAEVQALACMTKPYDPNELHRLLQRVPRRGPAAPAPSVPTSFTAPTARPALRQLFAQQWPALRLALEAPADAGALREAVHALRGSLAVLSAPQALALARSVEEGLRAGQAATALPLPELLRHCQALAETA